MERHDEINLSKVNKILVDTNIDPKKVRQWNIVAKKYYNSTDKLKQILILRKYDNGI